MVTKATVPEGDAQAQAQDAPKQRKRTKYEEAGVPAEYLGPKGNFLVGHDAKYKSRLINTILGDKDGNKGSGQEQTDAATMLQKLGWTHHLDSSRQSRQTKTERAERRAREQAEAKQAAKAQAANEPTAVDQYTNHVEARKAAKAHEGQHREVTIDGRQQVVLVEKVQRAEKNDPNSPYVARAVWYEDPENQNGRHEVEIETSELRELAPAGS